MDFLAKSKPRETLREHTNKVNAKLEDILRLYGDFFTEKEKRLLRIACEYHDYGKIERVFQMVMRKERRLMEMPHGFLSGLFLYEDAQEKNLFDGFSDEEIRALYTAIHYHHTRADENSDVEYREYAHLNLQEHYKIFTGREFRDSSFRYLRKRLFVNDSAAALSLPDEITYQTYLLLKGILNKADYAASGNAVVEMAADERLTAKITDKFGERLRPAQIFMRDHRDENIVVIAPTGSGKTEGAILWLNDAKGFYTLPLKVSAGAIYHRIYDKPTENSNVGYHFKSVGLLHSDSVSEYLHQENEDAESPEDRERYDRRSLAEYQAVRSLAYPLTVTTIDQLFKFVFKALGTEIFAATLKYSRVIIDEMQMYEPRILAMLIYGLKIVSQMGGKFAIITATLPEFVKTKLEQEGVPFASSVFPSDERRHIVRIQPDEFADSFDLESIREAGKSRRVLVICNTVLNAQKLKGQIPEARLLHSRFIKSEREVLEREIVDFQNNDKSPGSVGIWITTQLVEASLDIDFDLLHTELSTADSLLQRMGRCWRSRTYTHSEPNVFVYDHGPCGIYGRAIYTRTKEFLRNYEGRIFIESEKLDFINAVFDQSAIKETDYYRDFVKSWNIIRSIPPIMYSREEADKLLRNIQSVHVIPESIYNKHQNEIDEIRSHLNDKTISLEERYRAKQNLDRFTISIAKYGGDSKYMDRGTIPGTQIHRTRAVYSSIHSLGDDGESGLGLLREEDRDDGFL